MSRLCLEYLLIMIEPLDMLVPQIVVHISTSIYFLSKTRELTYQFSCFIENASIEVLLFLYNGCELSITRNVLCSIFYFLFSILFPMFHVPCSMFYIYGLINRNCSPCFLDKSNILINSGTT